MASTTAISLVCPPPPLPRFTFKRLYPNPPPKAFPLFSCKFRQSRVFVARARPIFGRGGGYVKYNESPSELRQREGRACTPKNDGDEKSQKILKLLAYIMLFGSADGDINKGVEERRRELVLQYMACNHGGAIVPKIEYYRYLARLLKDWHTDVQEQEQRSREVHFRRLWRIISLVRKVLSWIRSCIHSFVDFIGSCNGGSPFFAIQLLLCVVGVLLCIFTILFFPVFLIWRCFSGRPDPPPSPPPFNPTVVKKLFPFINPGTVKKNSPDR